jgi:hypothetical protein
LATYEGRPATSLSQRRDNAKANLTQSVKRHDLLAGEGAIYIPPGCTSLYQVDDVALNKELKRHIRKR